MLYMPNPISTVPSDAVTLLDPPSEHQERLDLTVDAALERAGGFGRFQTMLLLFGSLAMTTFTFNTNLAILLLPRLNFSPAGQTIFEDAYFFSLFAGMLLFGSFSDGALLSHHGGL